MTDNHPITPSPELVQAFLRSNPFTPAEMTYEQFIATRFARWGADQELEACSQWIHGWYGNGSREVVGNLYAARRPKFLSLKKQALALLDDASDRLDAVHENTIRRALETLPDD